MAMNGDLLGSQMIAAMDAVPVDPDPATYRLNVMKAMATAIVAHIQTFAVVTSVVTVASVSGVTTGPGASGPGAGTATGTVG